jgi:RND family efflux transporter MFP subunit
MRSEQSASVPVQVAPVSRQAISQYLETNGVLEAENEVDLVARLTGPITELLVEEGLQVSKDQCLARIDDRDARNQVAIAKVSYHQAELALERAQASWDEDLISREAYDKAVSDMESAAAQLADRELDLSYTEIRAPFKGLIVTRYIKQSQHVSTGTSLFRISDFNPLLCPIQVPEKDLASLRIGQPAHLRVEAFPDERFSARVLRISPTVDSSTGTIKVTLEVEGRGRLRPGMFASVFLVIDRHESALVIPRDALVLDSIGDTVFVRDGEVSARREVKLGFRELDLIEVLEGIEDGEEVIILGQEGLTDGTPIQVMATTAIQPSASPRFDRPIRAAAGSDEEGTAGEGEERAGSVAPDQPGRSAQGQPGGIQPAGPARPGGPPMSRQGEPGAGRPRARPPAGSMAQDQPGRGERRGMPPHVIEMLRNATPEQLELFKQRMRDRGMSDEEIEKRIREIRGKEK